MTPTGGVLPGVGSGKVTSDFPNRHFVVSFVQRTYGLNRGGGGPSNVTANWHVPCLLFSFPPRKQLRRHIVEEILWVHVTRKRTGLLNSRPEAAAGTSSVLNIDQRSLCPCETAGALKILKYASMVPSTLHPCPIPSPLRHGT